MTGDVEEPPAALEFLIPGQRRGVPGTHGHRVEFYRDEDTLVRTITGFVAGGLRRHESAIIVATAEHIALCERALEQEGLDVRGALARGGLVVREANDLLATFLTADGIDMGRFRAAADELVERARASSRSGHVRVYGEMVDVLLRAGKAEAVLQLEELWGRFVEERSVHLLCGYWLGSFADADQRQVFDEICAHHGRAALTNDREPSQTRGLRSAQEPAPHSERERLARLERVMRALGEVTTTREIGDVVLGAIAGALGAEVGSLTLLSGESETVEVVATVGIDLDTLRRHRRVPLAPAPETILSGIPVYMESPDDLARIYPETASVAPFNGGSRVIVPLAVGGRPRASLNFGFSQWRPIEGDERDLLRSVGDVTAQALERARLFEEAERRRLETELIFRLSDAANRTLALEEIFEPALDAVCRALNVERASILINDEKRVMRFRAWRGLSEAYRRAVEGHSPWQPDETAPQPIFVADVNADPALAPYRSLFASEKIAALGFIPLFQQRRLLGKFMVYAREPRRFSAHDERLAQAIASQVAQAVIRAELLESERRERVHAERLADTANRLQNVTAALSKASSVTDVADVIVVEGARCARAATAGLWLLDGSDNVLELVKSWGYRDADAAGFRRVALDSPLPLPVLDAVRTGEPIFFASRAAFGLAYPEVEKVAAVRPELAIACLPMLAEGRCVGALAFTFDEVHEFAAEERHPLLVLARHCAQAVGRAQHFDLERRARSQAEAAQERTAFLLEASALLSSSLDFEETLQRLTRLAVPRMADWCGIELATTLGEPSQQLALAHVDPAKVTLAKELRNRWPPDPDAPRGAPHVIRTGVSELYAEIDDAFLEKAARDPEHLRVLRDLHMRSAMVVPMVARGRTFGAITFVAAESGRRYGKDDVALAELLGRRAGIAIDNALLYKASQAATRARENVLAIVSHDLRNPLNVIQLGARTLARPELAGNTALVTKTADSIQRSADRMARLIQDLLDFAGLESDRYKIAVSACRPEEIVIPSVEMFSELARERGVRLETRVPSALPSIPCDRDRAIQALGNLVSNAVSVTPKGGCVTVVADRVEGELILRVEDTGPGIRPEHLARLFQPYWRGDPGAYKGTGLGLAIAKTIADAHGGRIWAESTLGSGSRFSIALALEPRVKSAAASRTEHRPLHAPAPGGGVRPGDCLAGGGEMGALMRSLDWSKTAVGPVEDWPQSLRTAVSILLESKFPMYIAWGPEYVQFYNDGYRPILGSTKHPAIGKGTRETFAEIWPIIGPMFAGVRAGKAVGFEDFLLPLERHGYAEECYFIFSYSPIRDESGGVGGVHVTVTETTARVIGERRLRSLRDLAARATQATDEAGAWSSVAAVLDGNPADLPFALLYALGEADGELSLVARAGVALEAPIAPVRMPVAGSRAWPVNDVVEKGQIRVIDDIATRFGEIKGTKWPEPLKTAVAIPIARPGEKRPYGLMIAGTSPRRAFDENYRDFLNLVATHVATAVGNARAHEEERRRAEALADLDRAKTTFFSNVSHEFRTPLSLMLGPLEDLLGGVAGHLANEQLDCIRLAHRNALRLLKLANTLLDFARIEAGRSQASFEPTDLARVTSELASAFHSAIERAGLRYVVDCEPLPEPVHVDRDMWEKIVLNLVSNALKFTLEGEVHVALRWRGSRVELAVKDTGVGIPSGELDNVFKRFHRVHGTRARTQEGSGIGLALVQELARLHGGSVSVESEPGRGSIFTVTVRTGTAHLPKESIGAPRTLARTALGAAPYVEEALRWLPEGRTPFDSALAVEPGSPSPERVLVADDNADMREYVRRILGSHWTVEAVADGAMALAVARERVPDLVLTDVMMPALDGFGLLAALKADPRTRSVPVVMVSARAGEEARIEGLLAGADDYLVKPFSARELIARVKTQLSLASARRALEKSTAHMYELFMQAPAPICVLRGPDLVFEMANELYHRFTGRTELSGRRLLDAFPELAGQRFDDILRGVMRTGEPYVGHEMLARFDRSGKGEVEDTYWSVNYTPLRDLGGRVDRVMAICFEVTGHVHHRKELENARRQAETASRAKDEFFAMLGHELRNPIAPIVTALHLMKLESRAPFPRERELIERHVGHLVRLVDDLLDVSRITRGKVTLARKRVDLAVVLSRAIDMVGPLLEEHRHELVLDLAGGQHFVDGDEVRLVQVATNLLANAAKYTPPGGRIHVSASRRDGHVSFSVADTGIGIEPGLLPRVFDLFVQGHKVGERVAGGLGLGLSIVRSLVELHGGTVEAASDGPGKGSRFTVHLPEGRGDISAEAVPPPAPMLARRPRKVLVVDDNRDAAEMLAEALAALGHETRRAFDGPTALSIAAEFAPEVALLDIGLPVMDGWELARRIRQLDLCAKTRLFAVTGYGSESDLSRSKDAGFDGHFVKPVDPASIARAVEA